MPYESAGAYKVFVGKNEFSGDQVDSIYGGSLPVETSTTPYDWQQLFTKGALTLSRSGETLELENEQEGLVDVVISGRDEWEVKFDLSEIDAKIFFNLLGLTPDQNIDFDTTDVLRNISLNNAGVSMLSNGFPVFFYRKQFDPNNLTDTPKVGTGSDPLAFCFAKGVLSSRDLEISYDAKGQMVVTVSIKPVSVNGTTNKGVGIVNGHFDAEA